VTSTSFGLFKSKIQQGWQACVLWRISPADVLLVNTQSRCYRRVALMVFKPCVGKVFAGVFLLLSSSFDRQWMIKGRRQLI
jgi:hypothetical protein